MEEDPANDFHPFPLPVFVESHAHSNCSDTRILSYIAGCFVKSISKTLDCKYCKKVLHSSPKDPCSEGSLIILKSCKLDYALEYDDLTSTVRRGLVLSSTTAVVVVSCKFTEI